MNSRIREDLGGWFLSGRESVEFKGPTIPLDSVERSVFQIVLAQEWCFSALSHGGRKHCQADILQTVAIWKK